MNCLEKRNKFTELVSVKQLLSNTKIGQNAYRIPDYQRGYAWDQQFIELRKDILRVYSNTDSTKRHYTGMLSLEEMNKLQKEHELLSDTNSFYVVDGQQRLTSIIIIIKALIEYIKDECGEDLESDLLSFDSTYKFDYSIDRDDEARTFFTNRIYLGEKNDSFADMYLKNINDAKVYIDEYLIKFDVFEQQLFQKFYRRLRNNFKLELPPKENIKNIYFYGCSFSFEDRLYYNSIFKQYDLGNGNFKFIFLYSDFCPTKSENIRKFEEYFNSCKKLIDSYFLQKN